MSWIEKFKVHFIPQMEEQADSGKAVEEVELKKSKTGAAVTIENNSVLRPKTKERIVVAIFSLIFFITLSSFIVAMLGHLFFEDKVGFFEESYKYGFSILIGYFLGYNKEK